MNIKYRNFFTITPIFFIIVLIISILNYNSNKDEIMWKINEEAKSIAIGSSVFIDNIIKDSSLLDKKDEILIHLKRIKKYNQAEEFYITDKSNNIIFSTEKNSTKKILEPKEIALEDKNIFLSKIYQENNNSYINASTDIKENNNTVATLTVKVNANSIIKHLDDSFLVFIITIFIVTIIGIILSQIISDIVIKRIKILKGVAKSIAEGDYNEKVNFLDIKEFKDLENTLNTMKSIMQEILFKAKNSIIEQKQFSSKNDLYYIYSNLFLNSKRKIDKNIEVAIEKIGTVPAEFIFNIVSNNETIFLYFGEIEAPDKSIDTAIKASSANYYLSKKLMYSNNNLNFLDEFRDNFFIKNLLIIKIDKNKLNVEKYQISKNRVDKSYIKIDKDKILYFHTLDKDANEKLDVYIKNYKFLNIKELSNDLNILFKDRYNGLILLIKI